MGGVVQSAQGFDGGEVAGQGGDAGGGEGGVQVQAAPVGRGRSLTAVAPGNRYGSTVDAVSGVMGGSCQPVMGASSMGCV